MAPPPVLPSPITLHGTTETTFGESSRIRKEAVNSTSTSSLDPTDAAMTTSHTTRFEHHPEDTAIVLKKNPCLELAGLAQTVAATVCDQVRLDQQTEIQHLETTVQYLQSTVGHLQQELQESNPLRWIRFGRFAAVKKTSDKNDRHCIRRREEMEQSGQQTTSTTACFQSWLQTRVHVDQLLQGNYTPPSALSTFATLVQDASGNETQQQQEEEDHGMIQDEYNDSDGDNDECLPLFRSHDLIHRASCPSAVVSFSSTPPPQGLPRTTLPPSTSSLQTLQENGCLTLTWSEFVASTLCIDEDFSKMVPTTSFSSSSSSSSSSSMGIEERNNSACYVPDKRKPPLPGAPVPGQWTASPVPAVRLRSEVDWSCGSVVRISSFLPVVEKDALGSSNHLLSPPTGHSGSYWLQLRGTHGQTPRDFVVYCSVGPLGWPEVCHLLPGLTTPPPYRHGSTDERTPSPQRLATQQGNPNHETSVPSSSRVEVEHFGIVNGSRRRTTTQTYQRIPMKRLQQLNQRRLEQWTLSTVPSCLPSSGPPDDDDDTTKNHHHNQSTNPHAVRTIHPHKKARISNTEQDSVQKEQEKPRSDGFNTTSHNDSFELQVKFVFGRPRPVTTMGNQSHTNLSCLALMPRGMEEQDDDSEQEEEDTPNHCGPDGTAGGSLSSRNLRLETLSGHHRLQRQSPFQCSVDFILDHLVVPYTP